MATITAFERSPDGGKGVLARYSFRREFPWSPDRVPAG
jgi:hypothetical protein